MTESFDEKNDKVTKNDTKSHKKRIVNETGD